MPLSADGAAPRRRASASCSRRRTCRATRRPSRTRRCSAPTAATCCCSRAGLYTSSSYRQGYATCDRPAGRATRRRRACSRRTAGRAVRAAAPPSPTRSGRLWLAYAGWNAPCTHYVANNTCAAPLLRRVASSAAADPLQGREPDPRLPPGRVRRRHVRLRQPAVLRQHRRSAPELTDRRRGAQRRAAAVIGWSRPTAGSSRSATRASTARPGAIHLNQPIVGMASDAVGSRLLVRRARRRDLLVR